MLPSMCMLGAQGAVPVSFVSEVAWLQGLLTLEFESVDLQVGVGRNTAARCWTVGESCTPQGAGAKGGRLPIRPI